MALLPTPTTYPTLRLYTSCSTPNIIQASAICITARLKTLLVTIHSLDTAPAYALLQYHLVSQPPRQTGLLFEVTKEDETKFYLTQILAILGYMEDLVPSEKRLLPPAAEAAKRAKINELLLILSSNSSVSPHVVTSIAFSGNAASDYEIIQRPEEKDTESRLLACESLMSPEDEISLAHTLLIPLAKHAISNQGMDIAADPRFETLWPVFRSCMGMWEFREGIRAAEQVQNDSDDENTFNLDNDPEVSDEDDTTDSDDERKYEGTLLEFNN